MTLYRVRIRLAAPVITAFASGTIFGHLCWARREREGDAALQGWFADWPARWMAVSDGLPRDQLPVPLLPPPGEAPSPDPAQSRKNYTAQMEARKTLSKRAFMPVEAFKSIRDGVSPEGLFRSLDQASPADGQHEAVRAAHNTINRLTGTTPAEGGGLFFHEETWSHGEAAHRDIYVRTPSDDAETLRALFTAVGEDGFGRAANRGRGHFRVEAVEVDPEGLDQHRGERRLSLSRGTITGRMTTPRYRLETHYGKLGGQLGRTEHRPWKRPLVLTRPGATFTPADEDGPCGDLLTGVHADREEVRHNALHLAIPFTEAPA